MAISTIKKKQIVVEFQFSKKLLLIHYDFEIPLQLAFKFILLHFKVLHYLQSFS